ncbi:MAG: hypothetical protein M3N51_09030, partial [Actinomycetota bacterium]|nr:hypothetical protein [Actinomycetota bacterium]
VVGMLVFAVTGVVIFGLKSADRMIILVSLMLVTLGAALFAPLAMVTEEYPQWARLVELVGVAAPPWAEFGRSVAAVSLVLATYLIPDGRFVPRWSRWLGAALVAHVALWALLPASVFNVSRWAEPLDGLWVVGWLATGVFAQIYRFTLVSGPEERRQTRLVVFALTTAVSAFLLLSIFDPQLGSGMLDLAVVTDEVAAVYELLLLAILAVALLLFPLSIAFSVLRYRLWEIDVLINRALVYGSLTALVALVYLLGVVVLGRLLGALFGGTGVLGTEVALVGSTALVTLSFQPARRRVQAVVDRNFYRRKYDAARTLQAFSEQLRHDADLDHLVGDLLTVVRDTMQPAHVSLWLRPDVEQGALQAYRQEGTP